MLTIVCVRVLLCEERKCAFVCLSKPYRRIAHREERLEILLEIRIDAHQGLEYGDAGQLLVGRFGDDLAMQLVFAERRVSVGCVLR